MYHLLKVQKSKTLGEIMQSHTNNDYTFTTDSNSKKDKAVKSFIKEEKDMNRTNMIVFICICSISAARYFYS
jgi:hypothetical protein